MTNTLRINAQVIDTLTGDHGTVAVITTGNRIGVDWDGTRGYDMVTRDRLKGGE